MRSVGAVLLLLAMVGSACAEPRRVLLINSFGRDFSPWAEVAREFRAELDRRSAEPPEVYDASLMSERFGADQEEGPFVEYLTGLFAKRRLDLIVAVGAPAARFVQRHRSRLFPSTPMLLTGIEQRRVSAAALSANDAVVASSNDFSFVVQDIFQVLPETTNIAVVMGNSPNEQYWREQLLNIFRPLTDRVAFTWLNDLSFEEMLKRVAVLPTNSAIIFPLLSVDAAGVSHEERKAFARLRAAANAPIFTHNDVYFGKGIVGGSLVQLNDVAQQSVAVALRIFAGEAVGDIKIPPLGRGAPKYDWRELQRWNISESRLPEGSQVHFRSPTVWEMYRWQLVGISFVVLLQAAMIAGLLVERRRRHLAELESRGRLLEVIHLNSAASAGVLSASFAHELNQPLTAIRSNADAAELLMKIKPHEVGELMEILADLRRSDEHAAGIIERLGGLLKKRINVEVREFDLNVAVGATLSLLNAEAASRGIVLQLSQAQVALPVSADQIHIQQVIINLAINGMDAMVDRALKSRVLQLETGFARNRTEATLSVSDSGIGIPSEHLDRVFETFFTTKPQGNGLGLSIARTIVEKYGGKIWAENKVDGGTVFHITLPLVHPTAAECLKHDMAMH